MKSGVARRVLFLVDRRALAAQAVRAFKSFEPEPALKFDQIYELYSQPFFDGDYKVLRGGSWAVAGDILRPSFRNWDHPIRRQIFSGFRCATDG